MKPLFIMNNEKFHQSSVVNYFDVSAIYSIFYFVVLIQLSFGFMLRGNFTFFKILIAIYCLPEPYSFTVLYHN